MEKKNSTLDIKVMVFVYLHLCYFNIGPGSNDSFLCTKDGNRGYGCSCEYQHR